jgi:hypothetical protein
MARSSQDSIFCTNCGQRNRAGSAECAFCGAALVQTGEARPSAPPTSPTSTLSRRLDQPLDFERRADDGEPVWDGDPSVLPPRRSQPRRIRSTAGTGCVAIYAGLLGFSAVLSGFGGMALTGMAISNPYRAPTWVWGVAIIISYATALLYGIVAVGLWNLRNWARIVILIIHGLGILSGLGSLAMLLLGGLALLDLDVSFTPAIIATVVPLLINGVILHWFWVNGDRFD